MSNVQALLVILNSAVGLMVVAVGALTWTSRTLIRNVERKIHAKIDSKVDGLDLELSGRIDSLDLKLSGRIDKLGSRIDQFAAVTDVRLAALETDVHLVKQHLLGSPAA